jgi:hypothetical protein
MWAFGVGVLVGAGLWAALIVLVLGLACIQRDRVMARSLPPERDGEDQDDAVDLRSFRHRPRRPRIMRPPIERPLTERECRALAAEWGLQR